MSKIREVLLADQKIVLVSPPDVDGRCLVVQLNSSTPAHAFGHGDFGFVAAKVTGMRKGRQLKVTQFRHSEKPEGFKRELGHVLAVRQYDPSR